jgi:hypothetical protein
LKSGKQYEPFETYELAIVDVSTKDISDLDTCHAKIVPEWKSCRIVYIRQTETSKVTMGRKQSIWIYECGVL